jgi:hypothetical protein
LPDPVSIRAQTSGRIYQKRIDGGAAGRPERFGEDLPRSLPES